MKPIWIVDDDQSIRFVLEKALAREQFAVRSFANRARRAGRARRRRAAGAGQRHPHARRLGPRPAGQDQGSACPGLPVIIMTAYSDLDSAVVGVPGRRLRVPAQALRRAQGGRADPPRGRREPARGGAPTSGQATMPEMLGQAPAMQDVFRAIGRLSQSHVTVLITGESGTGKELVARALHKHSPRARRAVRRHQHRGDPEGPARERAVRPRARRLHRRADDAPRPLRAGRRRHAVPRRDRRHAVRPADAPAARAVRRPVLPRRRPPAAEAATCA